MNRFIYTFAVIAIFVTAAFANANDHDEYVGDYRFLLSKYTQAATQEDINAVLVNYKAWGRDQRHQSAMASLQKLNPKLLSANEKMAFWINAYNLLTIDLIIKTGETKSIKNQGSLFRNVWKSHKWEIDGTAYTLDEIEHDILRPMGNPSVHMAINCASLSCPDLRGEPYDAKRLKQQLNEQTMLFLSDQTKGVYITESGLRPSKIFDWFQADFGGKQGVIDFIHRHLPHIASKEIDGYLDYNWRLNELQK
ncbi:MAG: DUF547 domain-containing protein [Alphaproteobacteria bacterium]